MGSKAVRRSWRIGAVALACTVGLVGSPVGATALEPDAQADPGATPAVAIPAPGSATSSPATSITLSGADPSVIGALSVTGSQSGVVAGRTDALARGEGVVFTPDAELVPGETVEVTSSVAVVGADEPTWSFTVATPAPDPGFDLDGELGGTRERSGGTGRPRPLPDPTRPPSPRHRHQPARRRHRCRAALRHAGCHRPGHRPGRPDLRRQRPAGGSSPTPRPPTWSAMPT